MTTSRRWVLLGCLVAALVTICCAGAGVSVRAAHIGAAAVDEPQYLLSALSLFEDGDLNIADERAAVAYADFHGVGLLVQSELLPGDRRISPHDPLLPVLLAIPMGLGGYLAAKWTLVGCAGLLAALTTWLMVTRFRIPVGLATLISAIAGSTPPLSVYAHQVYPEIPAALATVIALLAIVPRTAAPPVPAPDRWGAGRICTFVLAITALPWLAIKYVVVAAALAALGLWSLWRRSPKLGYLTAGILALSGAIWLAGHHVIYGGWTAYATGDHFTDRGEFSAVGFAPNYWGRSVRLVGLFTDRDFGLLAWQPAWLVAVLAVGWCLVRRRWELIVPLAAGWCTATFAALTMHGYWWPGRQVVVILPVLVVACAVFLHGLRGRWRKVVVGAVSAAALWGGLIQGWLVVTGLAGQTMWVLAPDQPIPAGVGWLRLLLPDYRERTTWDWGLHSVWLVLVLSLGYFGGRAARIAPVTQKKPLQTANTIDS